MKRVTSFLLAILITCACTETEKHKLKRERQLKPSDRFVSSNYLYLDDAKLAMYIHNFRKGMFECNLGYHTIYLEDDDIDNLDVIFDSIIRDGDTTRYYPHFYFLDTCNVCFLKQRGTTCELIRIKGHNHFYPVKCGYGITPEAFEYDDSVNSLSDLQGMEFDDYPYYARRDSFRSYLEVNDRSWITEEVRCDFIKENRKKLINGATR